MRYLGKYCLNGCAYYRMVAAAAAAAAAAAVPIRNLLAGHCGSMMFSTSNKWLFGIKAQWVWVGIIAAHTKLY